MPGQHGLLGGSGAHQIALLGDLLRYALHLALVVRGDGLLQVAVELEDLHFVDVLGDLGVDVAVPGDGVGHLQRHHAGALVPTGAKIVAHLELSDDIFAVRSLRQAQVENVAGCLIALVGAEQRYQMTFFRLA